MNKFTARILLGLPEEFTDKELKKAYAAGAKRHHPEEEPEKFREIQEAYLSLQDIAVPEAFGGDEEAVGPCGQEHGDDEEAVGPNGQEHGGDEEAIGPNGQEHGGDEEAIGPNGQEHGGNEEASGPYEPGAGCFEDVSGYDFERAINEAEMRQRSHEGGIDLVLKELDREDAFIHAGRMTQLLNGLTAEQLEAPRFQAGLLGRMRASRMKVKGYGNNRTKSLACRPSVMDAIIERYGFRRVKPGTLPPEAEELRAYLDKARGSGAFVSFFVSVFLWTGVIMLGVAGYSNSEAGLAPLMGLTIWVLVYPAVKIIGIIIRKRRGH